MPKTFVHPSPADRYLRVLCVALACYAIIGKGFAYLGVPPLFVGEMLLLVGLWLWAGRRFAGLNAMFAPQLFLIGYMLWGLLRTVPDVPVYGTDALRDAVVWGYGLFALVVSGLILSRPRCLEALHRYFFTFVKVFLITSLPAFLVGMWLAPYIPNLPGSEVPIFGPYKTADVLVHLTGVFAYLSVCMPTASGVRPWMIAAMSASLISNFNARAGLIAFCCGALIVSLLRPFNKLGMWIFGIGLGGLGL